VRERLTGSQPRSWVPISHPSWAVVMTDTLISVDSVSKKFCRSLKKSLWYGMQDLGQELRGHRHGGGGELRPDEFWALQGISFELKRGECLGLIGHNGAGKTTLLRMLNGLIKPDQGRIAMHGRVGALIALGAGFNPILTGRENIYVNASVLGLTKRFVDSRIEEIIDFAGLGEFIDMPVQSFSSGMNVRLGFAVAAVLVSPDILFLDEVLAVGDIGFTIKCLNTVRRLSQDAAVVFVSHNMQSISSFCTRVIVLEKGRNLLDTPTPAQGIDQYYSLVKHEIQLSGTGEAVVHSIDLIAASGVLADEEPSIAHGTELAVRLAISVTRSHCEASVILYAMDEAMTPVLCVPLCDQAGKLARFPVGDIAIDVPLGVLELAAGKYSFVISVSDCETRESLVRVQGLRPFRVFAPTAYWGKLVRPAVVGKTMIPAGRSQA